MMEDTDGELDEEVHTVRSRGVSNAGLLLLWGWGLPLSQLGCVHQPGSSLNPVLLGLL